MIEDIIIKLIKQVEPLGKKAVTIIPATNEEINKFENIHKFILPPEVKAWLKQCDGANISPGGLYGLFSKEKDVGSIDWYFKEYPEWKQKGWIPIAGDGCGNLYILTTTITIPSTKSHPVFFLDQADDKPTYVAASDLWKFLFFLLEEEILTQQGEDTYWPFDKEKVIANDPQIVECNGIPLPWEVDES